MQEVWKGGRWLPLERWELVAKTPSGLRAPGASCRGHPHLGLPGGSWAGGARRGPVGNGGPEDREAGSPQEGPHPSFWELRATRPLTKFGASSLFG